LCFHYSRSWKKLYYPFHLILIREFLIHFFHFPLHFPRFYRSKMIARFSSTFFCSCLIVEREVFVSSFQDSLEVVYMFFIHYSSYIFTNCQETNYKAHNAQYKKNTTQNSKRWFFSQGFKLNKFVSRLWFYFTIHQAGVIANTFVLFDSQYKNLTFVNILLKHTGNQKKCYTFINFFERLKIPFLYLNYL